MKNFTQAKHFCSIQKMDFNKALDYIKDAMFGKCGQSNGSALLRLTQAGDGLHVKGV